MDHKILCRKSRASIIKAVLLLELDAPERPFGRIIGAGCGPNWEWFGNGKSKILVSTAGAKVLCLFSQPDMFPEAPQTLLLFSH